MILVAAPWCCHGLQADTQGTVSFIGLAVKSLVEKRTVRGDGCKPGDAERRWSSEKGSWLSCRWWAVWGAWKDARMGGEAQRDPPDGGEPTGGRGWAVAWDMGTSLQSKTHRAVPAPSEEAWASSSLCSDSTDLSPVDGSYKRSQTICGLC